MDLLLRCVIFFLLHPYLSGKPYNIDGFLQNATGSTHFVENPLHGSSREDFWARGDQTCTQLLKDSKEFLNLQPPSSAWLLKPAMAQGLLHVGCLTEQGPFFLDLIRDEAARKLFDIMAKQLNTSVPQNTTNSQQNILKLDLLRFNLESLHKVARSPSHHMHCSGIKQEVQNMDLKDFILGSHSSLQHAKKQCDRLGQVCAGVSSDTLGQFKTVARNGGYIIPQAGSKLWLHHCIGEHLRRRSTDPECYSEKESRIHKVMQWIPGVSGYYSAGSAIYYATQGCTDYAENRAIEASVNLGYDALFVSTGGVSGVVGAGVGIAVKPALKESVQSVIDYFKESWSG